MKTYEQTISDLFARKAEYDKKVQKRKQLISTVAAVTAAVLLITAIPVGAFIISHRADLPVEIPDTGSTISTDTTPVKPVLPENTEYFRNVTPLNDMSGSMHGMPILGTYAMLYIEDVWNYVTKVDGGYLHYMYVQCTADFTAEYDNYQIDLVLTDGNEELYHLTYNNEESAFNPLVAYNIDLFIPDGLEYCEVYLYFNVLDHETPFTENYADNHSCYKACAAFAKKYGYIRTSYGVEKPEIDRENLIASIEKSLHGYIYYCIGELDAYHNRDRLNFIRTIHGQSAYESELLRKALIEDALISYKKDRKEDYDAIVQEWIDYQTERYGQGLNNGEYHDPLEDLSLNSSELKVTEGISSVTFVAIEKRNNNNNVNIPSFGSS